MYTHLVVIKILLTSQNLLWHIESAPKPFTVYSFEYFSQAFVRQKLFVLLLVRCMISHGTFIVNPLIGRTNSDL